jgi:hypothetical protein
MLQEEEINKNKPKIASEIELVPKSKIHNNHYKSI